MLVKLGVHLPLRESCTQQKSNEKSCGTLPKHLEDVLWSDETKTEILALKENATSGTNPTLLVSPRTPSPL